MKVTGTVPPTMDEDQVGCPVVPSFKGRRAATQAASRAASGSSKKRDTGPELHLRRALWSAGLRHRVDAADLPGRPDIVFRGWRVAVFVDGDYWHGRDWRARREKLARGHNPDYWIAKIGGNMARDEARMAELVADGWQVLRFWETDIHRDVAAAVADVVEAVRARRSLTNGGNLASVSPLPPISKFEQPVLRALLRLGGEGSNQEIEATTVELMGLSPEQLGLAHAGDTRSEAAYRIAWARTRLKKAGLAESAGRARWRLTDEGRARAAAEISPTS